MRKATVTIATIVCTAAVVTAQPSLPSYAAPSDLGAGFTDKILGSPPKAVEPEKVVKLPFIRNWDGAVELGLAGTQGNSDVLKFRSGFNAQRKTATNTFNSDLFLSMARVNGRMTENKVLFLSRDEAALFHSKWSALLANTVEYDQFRTFNFREAVHSGLSRAWWKTDSTTFKTRAGAGVSYDVGPAVERWIPEGMFGYDFDWKLTDRQRMLSSGDCYPGMADWGQLRLRVRAAYELLIDPSFGLALRVGVQERFDSRPGPGTVQNDIDYFTTMLFRY